MKFGESLPQRSVPQWVHYNVDYDEVKRLIKEHTTQGNGKARDIPGQGDQLRNTSEKELFDRLKDEHVRVDTFVWSKHGEVKSRLKSLEKQLTALETQGRPLDFETVPAKTIEEYSSVENEALRAGKDVALLHRFVAANREAFRKLLKKQRRWSRSSSLVEKFMSNVSNVPGSFQHVDLVSTNEQCSATLHAIRTPFQAPLPSRGQPQPSASPIEGGQIGRMTVAGEDTSILAQLHGVESDGDEVDFDNAFAIVPRGSKNKQITYWVHPDNIVELRMLLLEYMLFFSPSGRRRGTLARQATRTSQLGEPSPASDPNKESTYASYVLMLDDLERLDNTLQTLAQSKRANWSHRPFCTILWTGYSDAVVSLALAAADCSRDEEVVRVAKYKLDQINTLFDSGQDSSADETNRVPEVGTGPAPSNNSMTDSIQCLRPSLAAKSPYLSASKIRCKRLRFTGLNNSSTQFLGASLELEIVMQKSSLGMLCSAKKNEDIASDSYNFPYAVLTVKEEGSYAADLVNKLNRSHLTKRVPNFSLGVHAMIQCHRPESVSVLPWSSFLGSDIRKLPAAPTRRRSRQFCNGRSLSDSATHGPASTSATSATDYTTISETTVKSLDQSFVFRLPDGPPVDRSKKKSKPRSSGRKPALQQDNNLNTRQWRMQRYWNEFDHPEEEQSGDQYVLYIDPSANGALFPGQETFSRVWGRIKRLFTGREPCSEQRPLLSSNSIAYSGLNDENVSETTSSSEDLPTNSAPPLRRSQHAQLFCTQTFTRDSSLSHPSHPLPLDSIKLHWITLSFIASIGFVLFPAITGLTSRRKAHQTVDVAIIAGVALSLIFSLAALATFLSMGVTPGKHRANGIIVWAMVVILFVGLCVANGALLAWVGS